MALSLLFLTYFAIHFCLLVWSFELESSSPRIWLIRALLAGMLYDNLMLMIAPWAIDQGWYLTANYPRYIMHASFLPFLMLFGWSAMKACGIRITSNKIAYGMIWILVLTALGWGWSHDVLQLQLIGREFAGHERLVSVSTLPPIATIASNLIMLPMAAAVWKVSGWKWFFLGALFIFLLNGATGAKPFGFLIGNGAEVVFILSLLFTERFLAGQKHKKSA